MTQTFSGYLIDEREYEVLVDIGKRLASARTNLGSVERQDLAGLIAMVLVRFQSMVVTLEHGLPVDTATPPAGEDDD